MIELQDMHKTVPVLPTLTVNRPFITEFVDSESPCFALGVVEVQAQECGLFALRPEEEIPPEVSNIGFRFGHSLYGSETFEVIHFAFGFYGFHTYNVLINPNNPLVQTVLDKLLKSGDYFFFLLDANNHVVSFRSEISDDNLLELKNNISRIKSSTTTNEQYQRALRSFLKNPRPQGTMLNWVCCNGMKYLDLSEDRVDLTPS